MIGPEGKDTSSRDSLCKTIFLWTDMLAVTSVLFRKQIPIFASFGEGKTRREESRCEL